MDINDFLAPLVLDDGKLSKLAIDFSHTYRHLALHSTEQFLATPINVLPKGTEEGHFLAVEVGGSNLRVGFVELLGVEGDHGGEIRRTHEKSWSIEDHFKMDNADELFSWIGYCIAEVVADYLATGGSPRSPDEVLPVGITFSFPMMQASLSEATLMPMGKGFAITSELNLGRMLLNGYSKHVASQPILEANIRGSRPALKRLPDLKITAITNDTVATLASLSYAARALTSSRVAMGLIVGTGTNSSVVLKLSDLHADKRDSIVLPANTDLENAFVVVNTEWTIKGAVLPLQKASLITKWDQELDRNCEAPGFQPFEYMTAGRYLGELARLVMYDYLVNVERVLDEKLPIDLRQRNAISTFFLSNRISKTPAEQLGHVLNEELPPPDPAAWKWDTGSAALLSSIARALSQRSTRMISAATVGLLASAGELQWKDQASNDGLAEARVPCEELIVAFAGGVITSYPGYLHNFQQTIDQLVDGLVNTTQLKRIVLKDANNGGLLGAGVLAGTVWNLD